MAVAVWLAACLLLLPGVAQAGQDAEASSSPLPAAMEDSGTNLPFAFDGPAPPIAPDVIRRDASGRATIRAVRITSPIRIDGQFDEAVYTEVPSISDFIQIEPDHSSPATEKTEVWIMFDRTHLYVSVRCWDSHAERIVANEMRRDNGSVFSGDYIAFNFDTFYDRRNATDFAVNPVGGRADGQITNEDLYSMDWNTVWDLETSRFEEGWAFETAIPFKSLRYRPGRAQIWGFNMQRLNKWKNEVSTLTELPAARGGRGIIQVSLGATLVGLEVPPGSKNLEIKPYVTSDLATDLTATPTLSNDLGGDVGLDMKYGITQNLTADVTYNTDFAQVEADEQQVNLTRFSLFFPEKREFFLENQGIFGFGGVSQRMRAGEIPILFYSRRVGLNQGRIVPIQAGGRLTGRIGGFSLGLLNVQTDSERVSETPATNFSVVRMKRDVLRRSSIGLIYTRRSVGVDGGGRNEAYGVDGTFAFFDNLSFNTYWARTSTPRRVGDDTSSRLRMDYNGDRYGVQLERLVVGDDFNPEVGFVRRDDMRRHFGEFRFSPRSRSIQAIRKFVWVGSLEHIENGDGRLETRNVNGGLTIQLQNSDQFDFSYSRTHEFLPAPFTITSDVTIPVGGYDFGTVRAGYNFGRQRPLSGNVSVQHGTFYSGDKTTFGVSRGRVSFSPQFSVEPSYSLNLVDLVEGAFTTHLMGSRVTYTMTPRMFVSALLQYNSGNDTVSTNVRLRWEYRPGSEMFLVYNEQRDTLTPGFPTLANRALIFKINRLFRL